ncbi:hypothetical protein DH2020_032873 [Rehmannia glutinosa]|uniref:Uncharacterized protein n=1 Tax=Rehmannia glutinosa TaxID=99300 RepID=A0ABR0VH40_REHGL
MHVKRDFEVKMIKTEVVAAALPMQDHWLPLSNLDLLLPPVDVGVFFCYDNNTKSDEYLSFVHMVGVLKKALAQTMVSYYAFAGELVKNSAGEPELLCNNGGVDFCEAFADVELEELDLYNPDESVEGKLVPVRNRGVLAVQVTQLNGGGLVVACTFAHQVADAYSANMFLVSWAEMAQSQPLSQPPSFRRSLLLPRRPGAYHHSVDEMEFSGGDNYCRLGIVVDGRNRLIDGEDETEAKLIASYFGNVLSIPFGEKKIEELKIKSLNWAANEVHEFLRSAVTKEHFLGLIDWVEEHRPELGISKIYAARATEEEPAVVVSPGRIFRLGKWISDGDIPCLVLIISVGWKIGICYANA